MLAVMSPAQAMSLAIEEAQKGFGFVAPNPVVGCVILDALGHFLASGYHKKIGGPHAEVEALSAVTDQARLKDAQVFVTLEPCSHFGRTPPCAEMLAKLPLKRVVFGILDPNPKVSGQGAERLCAAGIECLAWASFAPEDQTTLQALEELAEIFLYNQRQQKTFVALKVATSLDGRMALRSGESKWISGVESRHYSHFLRSQYDAVLIGKNTFLMDDPSLNVRLKGFEAQQNAVVLIDPRGHSLAKLAGSQLAAHRPLHKIWIATCSEIESSEVQILKLRKKADGQMDLTHLLELLWQNDIRSIFVEGGAHTFAGFLSERLVQRMHLFIAPYLIGGAFGISWTEYFGAEKMSDRLALSALEAKKLGRDLYFSFQLANGLL